MTSPESEGHDRLFWPAFAVCFLMALIPVWGVRYPAMHDLPHHVAQLVLSLRFDDPGYPHADFFEFNRYTPYMLGFAISRFFALFLSPPAAIKTVLSLYVLTVPLATLYLIRKAEGDKWLSLLAFPIVFGFAFRWGFFQFLVAVPAGLFFVGSFLDYIRTPSRGHGALLAVAAVALFYCHALVWGWAGLSCALAAVWFRPDGWKRWWPLAASTPFCYAWIKFKASVEPVMDFPTRWEWGIHRLVQAPSAMVGNTVEPDLPHLAMGLMLLTLPFLLGYKLQWRSPTVAPLLAAVVLVALFPFEIWYVYFLYRRFTIFLVPFLVASMVGPSTVARRFAPLALTLACLSYQAKLTMDWRQEVRIIEPILQGMDRGTRVNQLSYQPRSEAIPAFLYAWTFAWHAVYKDGFYDPSFAKDFPQLYRYRDIDGAHERDALGHPADDPTFYDYYLVGTPDKQLPPAAAPHYQLELESGPWRLYGKVDE